MLATEQQVTLATSSGGVWLTLLFHVMAGAVALVSGVFAVSVAKGDRLHRVTGMTFVFSMIVMGLLGSVISVYEGKSIVGGTFAAYLVFTAFTTVRPWGGAHRQRWAVALTVLAFALAAAQLGFGVVALDRPGNMLNGVPAGMILFIGTVSLLAAVGDLRVVVKGELRGARRLARHLWRMCFGLFIASGSFFLGQMKFLPESLRILPVLGLLAVAPLLFLLYWMWRVRLRHRMQGMALRGGAALAHPS